MHTQGRNRYVLTIEVEFDHPISQPHANSAADLLAHDIRNYLTNSEWGWGRARIESVYAPTAQFEYGDFTPDHLGIVTRDAE